MTDRPEKGSDESTIIGGFIRTYGKSTLPSVEVTRPDELSQSPPAPTPEEVKVVRKKRQERSTKLAVMGLNRDILKAGDPDYRNAVLMSNNYRKRRAAELSDMHGHVSLGASALLASSSLALAASRYLYERFAKDAGGDLGVGMLKQAAQLADSARQSELAAWELSAREGLAKRKRAAMDTGVPWLAHVDSGTKLGRKTNAERQERSNESVIVEGGQEVYIGDQKD